jgi:phosphoglycolate phosphatase
MLIVFDLDGTLIDSIGDLVTAVNRLVAEHGGRSLAQREVAAMVGEGASLLIERAFSASGVEGDPALALPRFLEIYDGILPGTTRPYPGVPGMLDLLAPVGPLAVLTNKPADASRKILAQCGLERHFVDVIGGDGPWPRKPHPDALRHLAAAAGARPGDTWMVGDSMIDLRTAHAAGTRACLVRYGFGFARFDPAELRGGEVFADHPSDIPRLLQAGFNVEGPVD